MAFLLPLLEGAGAVVAAAAPVVAGIQTIAPHFFGGGYSATQPSVDVALTSGGPSILMDGLVAPATVLPRGYGGQVPSLGSIGQGTIQAIEQVVPKWILKVVGGSAAAAAIYEEYKRWRAAGLKHHAAKKRAHARFGVEKRRRRMRPTNVHALRRAIRRVHGFRKIATKVGALHVGRSRLLPMRRGRRVHRRGDIDPFWVEDTADLIDEAEDAGIEQEEFFREVGE